MNVRQFYIEINGSYEDALKIMMNDFFIAKMITKFMTNNSCEQMISLYEQKDYRALFAAAHTLKGVTGNLSLTPLFELACTITEATRNSDDANLDQEIAELEETYNLIKEKYLRYIAPN